jgi:hypothetical protein
VVDAEGSAALVPSVIAADEVGRHRKAGGRVAVAVEYDRRGSVLGAIWREVARAVVAGPGANMAARLYDLGRDQKRIAAIV